MSLSEEQREKIREEELYRAEVRKQVPNVAPSQGKNKLVAALLALFFGGFGIHKFYLGQGAWGLIYLLFFWTFIPAILGLIECIGYLLMSQESFDRKYNFTSPTEWENDSNGKAKRKSKNKVSLKTISIIVGVFVFIVFLGWFANLVDKTSQDPKSTPESQEKTEIRKGRFLEYDYGIVREDGKNKYIATFNPFLPRNDTIVTGMIFEVIKQIYGKNTVKDLQPKIVERNGQNLIMITGIHGDYFVLLIKEDTGKVN